MKKTLEALAHESNLALREYKSLRTATARSHWMKAKAAYRRALNQITKDAKKKLQQLARKS